MAQVEGATPAEEVIVDAPVVGENTLEVETPETPAEPKSMDDTIRDTLRSLKSKGVEPEEAPEDAVEKAARIRDEKGKFAKPEAPKDTPVNAPETPQTIPAEVQRLGFKKEAAEAYINAPDVLKQEIQRRSDEMHRGLESVKAKAQFAETIERVLTPHQQTFKNLNVTPEVAIDALLRADHRLRYSTPADKQAAIFDLARQYGIDISNAVEQTQIDPNISHLSQQVAQTQYWIQQQEAQKRRDEQLKSEAEQAALNSDIAAFAADPKHSHFESVKGHMAALLQAGQAKDLADAYEQAIYANPTTRAALIAEQQAAAKVEASKKAQAAKSSASVNVKPRPSMLPSTPIGSMDDTIRQTLRRLQAQA